MSSDESYSEVVQVSDPQHPLYGRSFRVVRKTAHRGGKAPASYEVEFRAGTTLLIPIAAIEYYKQETNQIKLSIESLTDLISTVERPDAHEHRSGGSLGDVDARAPAPGRRGRRRCSGGDPS